MKRVFIKKEFNEETKFYFYNIYAVLKDEYNLPNHKKDEEYDGWYEEEKRYDIALREL